MKKILVITTIISLLYSCNSSELDETSIQNSSDKSVCEIYEENMTEFLKKEKYYESLSYADSLLKTCPNYEIGGISTKIIIYNNLEIPDSLKLYIKKALEYSDDYWEFQYYNIRLKRCQGDTIGISNIFEKCKNYVLTTGNYYTYVNSCMTEGLDKNEILNSLEELNVFEDLFWKDLKEYINNITYDDVDCGGLAK